MAMNNKHCLACGIEMRTFLHFFDMG